MACLEHKIIETLTRPSLSHSLTLSLIPLSQLISRVLSRAIIYLDACRQAPQAAHPSSVRVALSSSYLALLQAGFAVPVLLPALRCALTAPFHPYPKKGRYLSVALSVSLRLPDVIWRLTLWSPDFPPCFHTAIA